ncbi:5' nucleotidase, NT5C type [Clostridium akagii]|uniref:5' nucleotidase, NT5C type n=1 Tax=Clostridium akagii TaxID=91623 RepID=UPI0004799DC1|nr:nucleotidase [Clostridium akagii]
MKNLNICIDIDGTITDSYFWLDKAAEYFNIKVKHEDFKEYEFCKALGISEKDYNGFYEKYKFEYHRQDILRVGAKDVINDLYMNDNIYFVTARDKSLENITSSYLKNNEIHFHGLYVLGTHYKIDKAEELKCDIFIEDNLNNALQLSNVGFKVLLLDATYNRHVNDPGITRVYSWIDIYDEIVNYKFLQKVI